MSPKPTSSAKMSKILGFPLVGLADGGLECDLVGAEVGALFNV